MKYETLFSAKMDDLLTEEMQRTNTPATTIAIIDSERIALTRSYGAQDFETNIPANSDTLFCVASVTKSFICAGIMKLQEQGKLLVTDPVADYLPITIGFEDTPIQIHHLMSHQSGIPDLADSMWYRNWESSIGVQTPVPKYPFSSWDDGFRFLNGAQDYLSRPGERFHYNNFGYGILSKLITEVAGIPYKEYLRQQIFNPLQMSRTGFYHEIQEDSNLSKGYMDKPDSSTREFVHVTWEDIRLTRSLDEAAGGLFSSVTELANYMIMHLQQGRFGDIQVLSAESVEAMQRTQFQEAYPNAPFAATYGQTVSGYGYGFAIDDDFYGQKLVQHSGSFIGASAWFAFLPGLNRGAIMLSNHHPSPRIFTQAILLESMGRDCSKEWPLLTRRAHFERLSGVYHSYKGLSKVKISHAGGQLFLSNLQGENRRVLYPRDQELDSLDYYLPTEMGGRDPVQFIDDGENLWLHQERGKWRKVAELPA